jgi:hypothetical protein
MKITKFAAVAALAFSAASAQAVSTYNFSYASAFGTLSGQLTGTLQADNNTIVVDSFVDFVTFNSVPGPSLTFVNSFSGFMSMIVEPGYVSLDGTAMDLLTCTSAICNDGFLFIVNPVDPTQGTYSAGESFGADGEQFDAANWSIGLAGVPEPASWALMVAGFGLSGAALRRRRVIATA